MKTILVTGSSGFIGKHLVHKLKLENFQIIQIPSSIKSIENENTWQDLPGADCVYHLAARTYVPDSWTDTQQFLSTNVIGTQKVLEYCKKHNSKLIYMSAYLYGKPEHLPIDESHSLQPNNPYALSKCFAEQLCKFYSTYHDISVTIIRPFNIFGPGQDEKFLIPFVIRQVKYEDKIYVKDLKPCRDYIYIDDLIDALLEANKLHAKMHVMNIGSGVSYSVKDIINIIQEVAKTSKKVVSTNEERPNEIDDVIANIKSASELLNWTPKLSFRDGVKKMLETEGVINV